jgi:predicted phosphohydrolase
MRVLATADLHFDIQRSIEPTRDLAREVQAQGGDVLLIVGDVCGTRLEALSECLDLFRGFSGEKLFVAGNHDLWVTEEGDSLIRYEIELPAVCHEVGFHSLDEAPLLAGDVGFVGSVGWYDYSFRDATLPVPMPFYEAKMGPGYAAAVGGEWTKLFEGADDISAEMLSINVRWMDGVYVRLPFGDVEFTKQLAARLRRHIEGVAPRCRTIVAGVHHIPFVEMVNRSATPAWNFGNAFMGSERFGEVLMEEPKVRHVFCGHSHRGARITRGGLTCVNIGSTYTAKRFECLDL